MTKEKRQFVDDTKEPMSVFQERVAVAQATGEEWVETTPEIIKILQPRGMGGANYFCYHGVKVCERGQREGIEAGLDAKMSNLMHPSENIEVISG